MEPFTIIVRAQWDPEASVYVATSNDVPGLVAEAETLQKLQEKLEVLVPELLEMNDDGHLHSGVYREVPLVIMAEQVTKLRISA